MFNSSKINLMLNIMKIYQPNKYNLKKILIRLNVNY